MNNDRENTIKTLEQSGSLTDSEKEMLLNSIKAVNKELKLIEFKLERAEKVKCTTSVLLKENSGTEFIIKIPLKS